MPIEETEVTFQIIMVTMRHSNETYAILNYERIGWDMSSGQRVRVGFNEGGYMASPWKNVLNTH